MSRQTRNKAVRRAAKKQQRKQAAAHKDAVKDINIRINRNQKLLKEEKDPEHREKLKARIAKLESKKKMCIAKKRYNSEEAARLASLNERFTDTTRPYHCPHCGGWHLTSKGAHQSI